MSLSPKMGYRNQREALQRNTENASQYFDNDLYAQSERAAQTLLQSLSYTPASQSSFGKPDPSRYEPREEDIGSLQGLSERPAMSPVSQSHQLPVEDDPTYGRIIKSLSRTESSGNFSALNSEGYGGRLQFGSSRLSEAAKAGLVPSGSDGASFSKMDRDTQKRVEKWHFADLDSQFKRLGLDKYVGQTINGTMLSNNSLRAMAHLGGVGGTRRYLESGGKYNPADSNKTRLSDYARIHR